MNKTGIYKITSPSNKVYIGKAIDITRRKSIYRNLYCKEQPKLYNSLKKHGFDAHQFEIIEECLINELTNKEIYYKQEFIKNFGWKKALFCNIFDEGGGPLSEKTRNKISKAKKGHPCFNDEWREKIKITLNKHNHSQYYTDEVKKLMSEQRKGISKPFVKGQLENLIKSKRLNSKRVIQYDLNMNFVKEWESKGQAAEWIKEQTGKTSNVTSQIKDCILGRQKTAFGYKWKYKNM